MLFGCWSPGICSLLAASNLTFTCFCLNTPVIKALRLWPMITASHNCRANLFMKPHVYLWGISMLHPLGLMIHMTHMFELDCTLMTQLPARNANPHQAQQALWMHVSFRHRCGRPRRRMGTRRRSRRVCRRWPGCCTAAAFGADVFGHKGLDTQRP